MFGRGRKKPKKKPKKPAPSIHETKIRSEHGTPIVSLLKIWVEELGIKMGSEIIVEKRCSSNPLKWEIIIKPKRRKEEVVNVEQAAANSTN